MLDASHSLAAILCATALVGAPRQSETPRAPAAPPHVAAADPHIIAWLTEEDPWASVIGADTPRVVVYRDGSVIHRRVNADESRSMYIATLSADELASLRRALGPSEEFLALKERYDTATSDLSTVQIGIEHGDAPKVVSVCAFGVDPGPAHELVPLSEKEGGIPIPAEFVRVRRLLTELDPKGALPWSPEWLEVMVWPYENAKGESIHWPSDWPGLDDPKAWPWGDGSYSIVLAGSRRDELRAVIARSEAGRLAVLIGGQEWIVAFRPVIPGGSVWKRVFAK